METINPYNPTQDTQTIGYTGRSSTIPARKDTQVYHKYAVHTVRKMAGLVEAVKKTGGRAPWTHGRSYLDFAQAVHPHANIKVDWQHPVARYGTAGLGTEVSAMDFFKSYPHWLLSDLREIWLDSRCWNQNGKKDALSVEGRLAIAVVLAKMAGKVSEYESVFGRKRW